MENDGRLFVPTSDLRSFGIGFDPEDVVLDLKPDDYSFSSKSGVTTSIKIGGQTSGAFQGLSDIDASIAFEFNRENAVVFSMLGCREHRIRKCAL